MLIHCSFLCGESQRRMDLKEKEEASQEGQSVKAFGRLLVIHFVLLLKEEDRNNLSCV